MIQHCSKPSVLDGRVGSPQTMTVELKNRLALCPWIKQSGRSAFAACRDQQKVSFQDTRISQKAKPRSSI